MSELATAKKFQFIGGNLALDFCNTIGGKRGVVVREHLTSPLEYIGWCNQAGVLTQAQAESCLARAAREPDKANAVVRRAIALREALFRILSPTDGKARPNGTDLNLLNQELSLALCRLRLRATKGQPGFTWEWVVESDSLEEPLGPVAHAAATLLTDPHTLSHIRICRGDGCGWVFIDSSKNHSRCWCDMRDCGNRAKIRRHRQKQRSGRESC